MSKHSSSSRIPSVLSIPEKLSGLISGILKIRFPMKRDFSWRSLLMLAISAILLLLSRLIVPLRNFSVPICVAAAVLAAVPHGFQAFGHIREKHLPLEECSAILAAVLAFSIQEPYSAVMILIFSGLLYQIEAYSLLHREAASDYLSDAPLQIRHMVETADEEKSLERKKLASVSLGVYVLFVMIAAVFAVCTLFHLSDYKIWLHRCLIFLFLSTPSALLFSSALTHFGAVFSAAKADTFFADDQVPETLSRCRVFAFSKTGTVTDGHFVIDDISPVGITEADLLRIAAIAESKSDHPIAMALKAAAGLKEETVPEGLLSVEEISGKGVSALFSGHQIYVGNAGLLENHGIWYQIPSKSGSAVHVAVDGTYRGYFMISDSLRENAFDALESLRAQGASTLVMLTGDVRSSARTLASALNFDMVKPELSPQDKGSAIRFLRSAHGEKAKIVCVGDGYHDADMFDEADVSVCLEPQKETDSAEVIIHSADIMRIPLIFRICRETERILLINSLVLLASKLLLGILGASFVLPIISVSLIDGIVSAAAVIYALTSLTLERRNNKV